MLILAFASVYLIWGSTYLAMRYGVASLPPFVLAGMRYLFVGMLLYPIVRWKTGVRPTAEHWKTAAISGCLLSMANGGVCWAEKTVPSGVTALLVATVCLWMVLLDWLRPGGHKPSSRILIGVALGFAGLVFLVGPSHLAGSGRINPAGAAILIVAALSWATGSLYLKHHPLPASPILGAAMQSLCGGVALWVAALLSGQLSHLRLSEVASASWFAVAYLSLFGSGVGLTSYVYILKKSTAARAGTYALVNPVVALFLGWLFAAEPFTLRTLVAALVILTAVLLVITAPHRDPAHDVDAVPAPADA